MSKSSSSTSAGGGNPAVASPNTTSLKPDDYSHSPVHYAVATGDHPSLSKILSSLPRLLDPSRVLSESDSLSQESLAEKISAVIDRRDNRFRETPLHLAVRLNDAYAARALAIAGADISLQNAAGWNPLHEALLRRCSEVVMTLVQYHHLSSWAKWRRRLPRLVAALRRMRDFYMEISFHFESSIVPFIGKVAPSDTYKIWKRDGNLRADTSLAGYDGLKIQRANQSFLFLGDGDQTHDVPAGSLLVLNHDEKKIFDAFESAGAPMSDADIASFCNQTCVYRPGMDVTRAELVGRTNWRRQEKTETVGEWKARVYEVHNVIFSFRSRKITAVDGSEQILPLDLELDEDTEEGFLVAENPRFSVSAPDNSYGRRHSSFVREERETVTVSRKSVDIIPEMMTSTRRRAPPISVAPPPQTKEKEYVKNLRPSIWLTEQFPLKTEELLPLLDILANKVKAVRRMRELLTTTFPPGTFPVKVAIPVVPTVRVVITFTKFVELPPIEEFYTPASSPGNFVNGTTSRSLYEDGHQSESSSSSSTTSQSFFAASSSSFPWLSSSGNSSGGSRSCSAAAKKQHQQQSVCNGGSQTDPFAIPGGYTWSRADEKSRKVKKSKSTRKVK
ncbi:OLC1v1021173C1 [Oldenlandia corymbosa var. corymbosa]|uniref:OLC1v1021173C1 n=1 Tax=Oldenlandia corymbosa var. corymbosa TaxID=529605 RepID=A0AAV1BV39_OLDCO|nr:OLC1v1021173C1 [Oldenlandia corymbosa var. corymbosa]